MLDQRTIPMAGADLDETDRQAVLQVLASSRLAMGPWTEEFERLAAEVAGCRHAVAVSSGTAGLHLLAVCAGLAPGDEVITTSFSFVASTNCFVYEGARPVFVDVEEDTGCLDPRLVEAAITPRTKAILAVDVFGHPADWDAIDAVAARHGLTVISDPCESIGSTYRGRPMGAEGIGGSFAFFPNKQITTGEGGMVLTNRQEVAEACRSLRNQGRGQTGAWLQHERLGYNYRLDEMSAALGASQIKRLAAMIERRAEVARAYGEALAGDERIQTPRVRPDVEVSWFVYVVRIDPAYDRNAVMRALAERGIESRAYFTPIHEQPYIVDRFGDWGGRLPVTERLGASSLALPFGSAMPPDDARFVAASLRQVLDQLARR